MFLAPGALLAALTISLRDTNVPSAIRGVSSAFREQMQAFRALSSGRRINSAADDSAGFAVSEHLRSQMRSWDRASRNVQEAISMITVAEGAMREIMNLAQEVRELVVQAANDTNTSEDRRLIQINVNAHLDTIDLIRNRVQFNSMPVIDGTWGRYRHHWTRGAYAPGLPEIPGRPDSTLPELRNMFNFNEMPVGYISPGNNILNFIQMWRFNNHPDFYIAPGTTPDDIMTALNRSVFEMIGIDANHAVMQDPFNITHLSYVNSRAMQWLQNFDHNGTTVNLTATNSIQGLGQLLNSWNPIGADGTAVRAAQEQLIAAITGADLPFYYGGGITWGDNPRPAIPGQWIYDRNTILDPRQPLFFQVGPNSMHGFQRHIEDMSVHALGLQFLRNRELDEHSGVMLYNQGMFISARYLSRVDGAISYAATQLASMGATISRLNHAGNVADNTTYTHANAEMNVSSADMAREMMRFTRAAFRQNMSNYVLSQTNQHRNMVTQLIGGSGQTSGVFSRTGAAGNPVPASTMSWDS